ncbi:MAG: hypothetical protein ACREAA_21200 [Candidatus Polarisedimenticolia bacterium]
MQPDVTSGRRRRAHREEAFRTRLAGTALLGLAVLAWWMLRAAGIT